MPVANALRGVLMRLALRRHTGYVMKRDRSVRALRSTRLGVLVILLTMTLLVGSAARAEPKVVGRINVGGAGAVLYDSTRNLIYATGYEGVSIVDASSYKVLRKVPLDFDTAWTGGIAINRVTGKLYITRGGLALYSIDVETGTLIKKLPMPDSGSGTDIGVNETTNRIYVMSYNTLVTVVDGDTDSIITTIDPTPGRVDNAFDVAVNSITNRIYVTSKDALFAIDGFTNQVVGSATHGDGGSFEVEVNTRTDRVYVVNESLGGGDQNRLRTLDGSSLGVEADIQVASYAVQGMAVNEDANLIYIGLLAPFDLSDSAKLLVVDGSTNQIKEFTRVGEFTSDIAVNPDAFRIYLTHDETLSVLSEEDDPASTNFSEPQGTIFRPDEQLTGFATDAFSGVARVEVTFISGTLETKRQATLTCTDASRRSCSFTVALPPGPGPFVARAVSTDRAGNVEWPGPALVGAVSL